MKRGFTLEDVKQILDDLYRDLEDPEAFLAESYRVLRQAARLLGNHDAAELLKYWEKLVERKAAAYG